MFPLPLVSTLPQEYPLNHASIAAQQHLLLHKGFDERDQIVRGTVQGKEERQHVLIRRPPTGPGKAQCTHLFVAAPQDDLAAVAAKHGVHLEVWTKLSAEEKSTRERQWQAAHGQAPGPKQKQGNFIATGEDLKV